MVTTKWLLRPATCPATVRSMSTARLYRVIVPAADIESAAHFYATLFGNPGARVSPGRHYFECGGVTLAVYSPTADGDERVPRPNFDHLYFAVDDLEALHLRSERWGTLSREVGDGGLPMGQIETRPWGERSFYLRDLFGNPLCFVDSRTLFTGTLA